MSYARLSKRPLLLRSFTGLEISEFDSIYVDIESRCSKYKRKRLSKRKRQRSIGAGRPFKLKTKERFLMLLVYYRLYITYILSGFLFDLDQSNVCRDICMLEPLIKLSVPLPRKLYKRTRRARTIDEVEEEYFPGFKAFIDSSEQEIPRPKDRRKRKSYYSGKKKKHTVKTQYMVNSEGILLLHKTGHDHARINDYEIFKNKHPTTPLQVKSVLDLGYLGVQNDFPTVKSVLPFRKKRKKGELSDEEKKHNRKHSKLRIIVEHTVSRIKKFGIMGTKFRNKLKRYDHASDIVSGLINFRIMMRTNKSSVLFCTTIS
jgi:hypothetical protein